MSSYFSDSDVWAMVQALNPTISYSRGWTVKYPATRPQIQGTGAFLMDALYDFYEALMSGTCDSSNNE